MGGIIAKMGTDKAGKFLFCLPMNAGALAFGTLWSVIGGLDLYGLIFQAINSEANHNWSFWLTEVMTAIAVILYCLTGVFFFVAVCKPKSILQSLLTVGLIGNLINAVFYWIDMIGKIIDGSFDSNMLALFITDSILYVLILACSYMMFTVCKSLMAIDRVGGSGWEGLNSDEIANLGVRKVQGVV